MSPNPKRSIVVDDALLRDFVNGKLDRSLESKVAEFIEARPALQEKVAALSNDGFLQQVRRAAPADAQKTDAKPTVLHRRTESESKSSLIDVPTELATYEPYQVIRELGRGGMGVVYLAKNIEMDRLEVLKVLNERLLDHSDAQQRFRKEIRSIARLNHPAIVTSYSILPLKNLLVFAMEHVQGMDLHKFIYKHQPLKISLACSFAQQLATGLQHAHERGLVHRDIKPSNAIVYKADGQLKLKILDFGLAKASSEKSMSGLTQDGTMLGTLEYMSPEQTLNPSKADIRADIYGLGCTLYHMLAGKPPFRGTPGEVMMAHAQQEPTAINLVRPEVPVELAAVIGKMMAKQASKRFQTPADVMEALAPFVGKSKAKRSRSTSPAAPDTVNHLASPSVDTSVEEALPSVLQSQLSDSVPSEVLDDFVTVQTDRRTATISRAKRRPTSRPTWLRYWPAIALLIAATLGGGGLHLARAFKLKTQDGTIVIEELPEDAEILVDGETITLTWNEGKDKAEINVKPGTHEIQLKSGNLIVSGEKVTSVDVRSGQISTVTYRLDAPELLTEVDLNINTITGEWRKTADGSLISPDTAFAAIELPIRPNGTYELSLTCVRRSGTDNLELGLVRGQRRFAAILDGFGGKKSGLALIDGRHANSNSTTSNPVSGGMWLPQDKQVEIICRVQYDVVSVKVDGNFVFKFFGRDSQLSLWRPERIPNTKRLFLSSHESVFEFSNLQYRALADEPVGAATTAPDSNSGATESPDVGVSRKTTPSVDTKNFGNDTDRVESHVLSTIEKPDSQPEGLANDGNEQTESRRQTPSRTAESGTAENQDQSKGSPLPKSQAQKSSLTLDERIELQPELLVNPGNEQTIVNESIPGWRVEQGQWNTGVIVAPKGAKEGKQFFRPLNRPDGVLSQTVALNDHASGIDAGNLFLRFKGWVRTDGYRNADGSSVRLQHLDSRGSILSEFQSKLFVHQTQWKEISDLRVVPRGTRSVKLTLLAKYLGGRANQGSFDALSIKTLEANATDLARRLAARRTYDEVVFEDPSLPRASAQGSLTSALVAETQKALFAGQIRPKNSAGMKLIWCPPGRYLSESRSQTSVVLTEGYWIGQTEVTQAQWKDMWSFLGSDKSETEPHMPVDQLSLKDAELLCEALTKHETEKGLLAPGWSYQLPTEAQWEHAAKAGTWTNFCCSNSEDLLTEYAWFRGQNQFSSTPQFVATKKPNPWGIYDMHGNVAEFCRDSYTPKRVSGIDPFVSKGSGVVLRGGSYQSRAVDCGSSSRRKGSRTKKLRGTGFRVVLVRDNAGKEENSVEPLDANSLFADQEWRDLLKDLDVSSAAIRGRWSKDGGILRSPDKSDPILELPIEPNGPFELQFKCVRKQGNNCLRVGFIRDGRRFAAILDGWLSRTYGRSGLELIDGKRVPGNDTRVDRYSSSRKDWLPKDKLVTVTCRVYDHLVQVLVDDKLMCEYLGTSDRLSPDGYSIRSSRKLFLSSHESVFDISEVKYREIPN